MADAAPGGWGLTPVGMPSQSTAPMSPQQAAAIRQTTAAMSSPTMPQYTPPASPQQNAMLQGLMNFGGQNNPGAIPNYGQTSNAVGLGAGTGGLSFPMFGGSPNGT